MLNYQNNKTIFFDELIDRYLDILNSSPMNDEDHPTSNHHLSWMLHELKTSYMGETKKHRWLGYIQGCMVMKKLITVNEERKLTRPIFNGK